MPEVARNKLLSPFLEADSARAALEVWKAHGQNIDLLVTDFDMRGLTGLQLVQLLRDEKPKLPILLMSGRPIEPPLGIAFLPKPFSIQALTETVRQCLLPHHASGTERGV